MIDVVVLGTLLTGTIALVSVCFYNIRRSRCTTCKMCGMELHRELMSTESLKEDKLVVPGTI
jgi:hypothetical protein